MRTFIINKLITTSTAKIVAMVTVITLLLAILLTVITSFVMLGELSGELLIANTVIGLIIPLVVAPFMTNLIKEATVWEQANQELKRENIERKRFENEASQKADNMQAVSELAIECAAASPDTDTIKLIAEKLLDITDALGVAITVYDSKARTLTTKHIAVSNKVLTVANKLVGYNLVGMVNHVTPENEKYILAGTVDTFSDLSEVTFGAIPKPVAKLIKNTIGIGSFTGLALSYAGQLIGTAIIAHKDGQPILDPDVYKILAHVSAVSIQRKNAENALRESETKFRTMIENMSDGLLLIDEKGQVIEWNKAQESLTGLGRNEALGQTAWDIQFQFTPEAQRDQTIYQTTKENILSLVSDGITTNHSRPFEVTIQSSQGDLKIVQQTVFSIPTEIGFRIGRVMHDVSTQKQAKIDREKLITELKAKNTELEQFTYTVSHDLKAPLITIKGFLGLLEKDMLEGNLDRARRDLFRINDAADKMHQLLNELLELSRIGRFVSPSQRISFETIVHDASAIVRGRLDMHNVKINIINDLPFVFADRTRMVQALQNLLDNAAKFMGDQKAPLIEIGTDGIDKDGKCLFFVRDNGRGVAPDQLERVFGLFQKLDPNADGTGIGLALVKRIIEVHGGHVWIQSDGIGRGTTVHFTLPTAYE